MAPGAWRRLPDAAAIAVYTALAFVVTFGLWRSGGSAATADNTRDHAQFLFFFQHAADAVIHLHNPLFTNLLGWPYGVNLMANTAFLGMAVPLIPVTLALGPGVSYAVALTIALAGTATAWYVVLLRHVTTHRGVAFAAGALVGFSPGIVGHGNGHPNISAQFLLPLIVSAFIRLRQSRGIVLGLLAAGQVFLNEELLLFTAVACGLLAVVYAISRPAQARAEAPRFLGRLGIAFGVAAALTAYPLWFQFLGPQHYHGPFVWVPFYWTNVASYPSYGANALAGRLGSVSALNSDLGETNAFLGLPLCLFVLVAAVALWRVLAVRAAAVVAAVFVLFSLGDPVRVAGRQTTIPGPWRLVEHLPFVDAVITPRLALAVVPAAAVILAVAADQLLADTGRPASADGGAGSTGKVQRMLVWGALAAILVPLTPTPLHTTEPDAVPAFITDGAWRRYVGDGTIVPVPPDPYSEATLRWLVAANLGPRFVDGYFLGPTGPNNPVARYGPPDRTIGLLLTQVAETGVPLDVTPELQAITVDDLRFWHADVLVLAPRDNQDVLRSTVDQLLGRPSQYVDGVWVWDVRDLRR
jgi:hypothetical protein